MQPFGFHPSAYASVPINQFGAPQMPSFAQMNQFAYPSPNPQQQHGYYPNQFVAAFQPPMAYTPPTPLSHAPGEPPSPASKNSAQPSVSTPRARRAQPSPPPPQAVIVMPGPKPRSADTFASPLPRSSSPPRPTRATPKQHSPPPAPVVEESPEARRRREEERRTRQAEEGGKVVGREVPPREGMRVSMLPTLRQHGVGTVCDVDPAKASVQVCWDGGLVQTVPLRPDALFVQAEEEGAHKQRRRELQERGRVGGAEEDDSKVVALAEELQSDLEAAEQRVDQMRRVAEERVAGAEARASGALTEKVKAQTKVVEVSGQLRQLQEELSERERALQAALDANSRAASPPPASPPQPDPAQAEAQLRLAEAMEKNKLLTAAAQQAGLENAELKRAKAEAESTRAQIEAKAHSLQQSHDALAAKLAQVQDKLREAQRERDKMAAEGARDAQGSPRKEEVKAAQARLESSRRENTQLRQRVADLERAESQQAMHNNNAHPQGGEHLRAENEELRRRVRVLEETIRRLPTSEKPNRGSISETAPQPANNLNPQPPNPARALQQPQPVARQANLNAGPGGGGVAGVGMVLARQESATSRGRLYVLKVSEGGAAADSRRIAPNDTLHCVNGTAVEEWELDQVLSAVQGETGSLVSFDMGRNVIGPQGLTTEQRFSVTLRRRPAHRSTGNGPPTRQ